MNCGNLVEIDLSNATELKDVGVPTLAEAKNLERLWLVRCKSITDIGEVLSLHLNRVTLGSMILNTIEGEGGNNLLLLKD
ncbi:hypothetical protein CQW23_12442 [Capsicum baccatum]|uniref:Uncharacterized protein n=1 Tax=Capsicum baccatum TaxID=33114 RepID=A0A2G2WSM0_CAPBA|nr:hypothetical protein CQW23_12442 [Capsicum baccatum]